MLSTMRKIHTLKDFYDSHDALAFGRPGCGAPARTKSGRIRTTLIGNPDIRYVSSYKFQIITQTSDSRPMRASRSPSATTFGDL